MVGKDYWQPNGLKINGFGSTFIYSVRSNLTRLKILLRFLREARGSRRRSVFSPTLVDSKLYRFSICNSKSLGSIRNSFLALTVPWFRTSDAISFSDMSSNSFLTSFNSFSNASFLAIVDFNSSAWSLANLSFLRPRVPKITIIVNYFWWKHDLFT